MEKECKCCGKIFKTNKNKQLYCSKSCGQCEKKIEKINKICEFSGCSISFQVIKTSNKRFCSRNCQNNWQKYSQIGENNGNFGRENKWGSHSDEIKKIIKEKIIESWSKEERLEKHNKAREKYKLINGHYPTNSPMARQKISEKNVERFLNHDESNVFKNSYKGIYTSIKTGVDEYYESSWEKDRMVELDNDNTVLSWTKKHKIVVKYKHNGIIKSYIPDFLIEYIDGGFFIEEVKGFILDENIFLLKKEACQEYCSKNNLTYRLNFMKSYEKYKHLI